MAKGIDIYRKFQTVTDWGSVQRSGVTFVYVKLTDGNGVAPAGPGDALVRGAKAAGLPAGGYHFVQANPGAAAQADILINEVERTGAAGLVPMLDLEDNPPGSSLPNIPDNQKRAFGIAFCQRVAARGYRPGVYMNNALAKLLHPDTWGIPNLVIWIARYGATPDPAAGRYDLHQYSSSGSVPGINAGGVDLTESYTDAHLDVRGAGPGTPPAEDQEDEDMSSDEIVGTGTGDDQPWQQLIVPVNGHRYLRIAAGWGAQVTLGGMSLVDDTPSNGVGSNVVTVQPGGVADADRPGPWDLSAKGGATYGNFSHVAALAKAPAGVKVKAWTNDRA